MSDHAGGSSGEEDYEVEGIVGHKDSRRGGRKYEIKWKGYKETTFEPRENLVPNSEDLVVDYDQKHPFKKSKLEYKQEEKSRKNEINMNFDSQSEYKGRGSNMENKKPNVETKRKRKLSKRLKAKIKSQNTIRKWQSGRSKKEVKAYGHRSLRKGKKKKSRRKMILESSGQGEYEVDLLLRHRDLEDTRMYLVKWKGYPKAEATWEPSSNLNCRTLVRQYDHLRGKWKRGRRPSSGSSDKQPSKRLRTRYRSNDSDHETKENVVKKLRRRLVKREDGTWGKGSLDDIAKKEDAAHTNGDEKETIADKNEKREEFPKSEKLENVGKADVNLDGVGEEKREEKGEPKDEVKKTEIPESKKGNQSESEKTKVQSPQGKKDKSPQGDKPEEDVEEKQVEDTNSD